MFGGETGWPTSIIPPCPLYRTGSSLRLYLPASYRPGAEARVKKYRYFRVIAAPLRVAPGRRHLGLSGVFPDVHVTDKKEPRFEVPFFRLILRLYDLLSVQLEAGRSKWLHIPLGLEGGVTLPGTHSQSATSVSWAGYWSFLRQLNPDNWPPWCGTSAGRIRPDRGRVPSSRQAFSPASGRSPPASSRLAAKSRSPLPGQAAGNLPSTPGTTPGPLAPGQQQLPRRPGPRYAPLSSNLPRRPPDLRLNRCGGAAPAVIDVSTTLS